MSHAPTAPGGSPRLDQLADEAHLWLIRLRESIPPELERRWLDLLAPEEAAANNRFRVESARRQHLAARALARTTLSRYVDIDPRQWEFRLGSQGKPEIAGPADAPPLRFNLSHTRGLVACVVTLGRDIGVDTERLSRRLRDPLALARHGFAAAERQALERRTGRARRELFCDLWTLKEAYVKARGAGFLALPARQAAYEIEPDGVIRLTLEPELEDRAEDWQVALLEPTADHRLSVAIRRGRRADLTLVTRELEPLSASVSELCPPILGRSPSPTSPTDAVAAMD